MAATNFVMKAFPSMWRSEEHTSELQSQSNLVCRLLLAKKEHLAPARPPFTFPPAETPAAPTERLFLHIHHTHTTIILSGLGACALVHHVALSQDSVSL